MVLFSRLQVDLDRAQQLELSTRRLAQSMRPPEEEQWQEADRNKQGGGTASIVSTIQRYLCAMHAIFGIFLYLASYWCHIFLHLRSPSWSTHARDTENVEYWVASESFSTTSGSRGKTSGVMDRPWNGACREAVNCAFFRKSSRNRLRSKRNCFNVDTFDSTRSRAKRSPGLTFSCTKRLRVREQNSRRIGRWNTLTGRRSAWLTSNLQLWIHSTACEAA